MGAARKDVDCGASDSHRGFCCELWLRGQNRRGCVSFAKVAKEIDGRFGHHNFHDGFTVTGAGNAARFLIRITTAANQWRIADTLGQLTTRSSGGCGSKDLAISIYRYSTYSALLMPAMKCRGVLIHFAVRPRLTFGTGDQFFVGAQLDALLVSEALRSFGDQHHVRT